MQMQIKNISKIIMLICFSLIILIGGSVYYIANIFGCEDKIIKELNCLNGRKKAVLFKRDCGATTATSYIVSILPINKVFTASEKYRVFTSSNIDKIDLKWNLDNSLIITVVGGEIFLQRNTLDETKIVYHIMKVSN